MPKSGYHHGNLRQALVDASLELIQSKGPMGFTLSEAAKKAGVTPAAVYRHFAGKDELMIECALQGHLIFADLMQHAFNTGGQSALKRFEATGRAYLAFARRHPGYYTAMFESGVPRHATVELASAVERTYSVLEEAARSLSAKLPQERRPPASMISAHIWSMSHGVVELFDRGPRGSEIPFDADGLLESGIGIYLRGLGLIPMDD